MNNIINYLKIQKVELEKLQKQLYIENDMKELKKMQKKLEEENVSLAIESEHLSKIKSKIAVVQQEQQNKRLFLITFILGTIISLISTFILSGFSIPIFVFSGLLSILGASVSITTASKYIQNKKYLEESEKINEKIELNAQKKNKIMIDKNVNQMNIDSLKAKDIEIRNEINEISKILDILNQIIKVSKESDKNIINEFLNLDWELLMDKVDDSLQGQPVKGFQNKKIK